MTSLISRRSLAAAAALMLAAGAGASVTGSASAATAECGFKCISVFSTELGSNGDPNFVEAILGDGGARVGQPVGLKPADPFDTTEDIQPVVRTVADFYAQGIATAEANAHYGDRIAVQQKYAPYGIPVEPQLCVGTERTGHQNEGLSLQPCNAASTVWVINAYPRTDEGYFPIINSTTTDYDRPFAMHLPRDAVRAGKPIQMRARRLQFREDGSLPARQIWGVHNGPLP